MVMIMLNCDFAVVVHVVNIDLHPMVVGVALGLAPVSVVAWEV